MVAKKSTQNSMWCSATSKNVHAISNLRQKLYSGLEIFLRTWKNLVEAITQPVEGIRSYTKVLFWSQWSQLSACWVRNEVLEVLGWQLVIKRSTPINYPYQAKCCSSVVNTRGKWVWDKLIKQSRCVLEIIVTKIMNYFGSYFRKSSLKMILHLY